MQRRASVTLITAADLDREFVIKIVSNQCDCERAHAVQGQAADSI